MADDGILGSVTNGTYTKTDKSQEATKTTTTNSSLSAGSKGTTYDKDMFLQLLTAEMQYQDPLEPTSNTEYVAELASFTQIEAIQAVSDQMNNMQANSLVGKTVGIVEDNQEIYGPVDFVTTVDGEICVSVNDKLYNVNSVQAVLDTQYYEAGLFADSFHAMVSNLPDVSDLTTANESDLVALRTTYNALTTYYKSRISSDDVAKLEELEKRMEEIKAAQKSTTSDSSTNETSNDNETE